MKLSAANPLSPFRALYAHRTLLRQFARRAIEVRHRASFLGLIWTVLAPLISLTIYTIVFGFVFGGRFTDDPAETNLDYALGVFLGLILFNFLGEVLSGSPQIIVNQPNFVKKVVFPLEVLPAATVGAALFSAGMSLVLFFVGMFALGHRLDWQALQLLVIFPPMVLLACGCAWFLAAFGVFIRDIPAAMPFVVQIIVFMSAVFYPLKMIEKAPSWAQSILHANPLLHAVECTRRAVLWHQPIDFSSVGYVWLCGLAAFFIGYVSFAKLRPAFADVI